MLFEVMLKIPPKIAFGLFTGEYTRWGSVIREATSGRIVAHLQEGKQIADQAEFASNFLQSALQLSSGNAIGALNLTATALSHRQIMTQLMRLQTLVGTLGVMDLGLSAISLAIMLDRMKKLEELIRDLYKLVSREFRYDRAAKLSAAMEAAEHATEMDKAENREAQARFAINAINEARPHLWRDVTALYGSAPTPENNQLMLDNLLQTMCIDSTLIKCYLSIDELAVAKTNLAKKIVEFDNTTRWLVHKCLGDRRAAFFHHEAVCDDDFYRYIAVEQWLRGRDDILAELVLANRQDFWNKGVLDSKDGAMKGSKALMSLLKRKSNNSEKASSQQTALDQAELLIENLERLRGFKAEIEAIERLGLSSNEWQTEIDTALDEAGLNLAEHDDYVLLVDKEWLDTQPDATVA